MMHEEDVSQWQKAVALYRDVLALPESERRRHIDTLDESGDVRAKLEQLLSNTQRGDATQVEEKVGLLMERLGRGSDVPDVGTEAMIGRTIGNWTVVRELGRGGMATVYLVKRNDVAFEQFGALKLLSLLMLASGGASRFEREQQLLARMHHPNIAMMLDGGVAQDGTPYLVTEVVDGPDLRSYCEQHQLRVRDVINLLLQVCAAVSHAHGNLILHRDIKPSNVMVTPDGQAKLVDFGIGKLADDAAEGTQTKVFTPKYAAPEQLSGGVVTTATDVYGLGILGRSLLGRPIPGQRELDRIFDMATHDEPSRRYGSVESLARDLRNWLENRPISAVADSPGYRARKYLSRHRGAVAAAIAILLTAVAGVSLVLWQARQTSEQLAISERTTQFLVQLFELADPAVAQGSPTTARDLLSRAQVNLSTINDDPVRDQLVIAIAQAYHGMSDFAEAEELLRKHLSRPLAEQPLQARLLLANAVFSTGQAAEAIELLEPATRDPEGALRAYALLGHFLSSDGQFERADEQFVTARSMLDGSQPPGDTLDLLINQARNEIHQGRYAQALAVLEEALGLARSSKLSLDEAQVEKFLAQVANIQGRFDDALGHIATARKLLGPVYAEDHSVMLELVREEADILRNSGEYQLAVEKLERASAIAREHLGDSTVTTDLLNFLSMAYKGTGQLDAAIATGMETSETLIRMGDGGNPIRANVLGNVASYQIDIGDLDEAHANLLVARDIVAGSLPATHPLAIFIDYQAQRIAIRRGEFEAALNRLTELAPMALESPGPGNGLTQWILSAAGRQALRLGQVDAAIDWFGQVREASRPRGEDSERFLAASADLAEAMLAAGEIEKARDLLQPALAARASASPELEASLRLREAQVAKQAGDVSAQEALLDSALALMPEGSLLRADWSPEIEALSGKQAD